MRRVTTNNDEWSLLSSNLLLHQLLRAGADPTQSDGFTVLSTLLLKSALSGACMGLNNGHREG